MYFCEDVDLAVWEPGVFGEAVFGHQVLLKEAAGTLTGTSLVMGSGVLGDILPGMVATVALADGSASQLLEIVSVADATHAVVSVLRGRESEAAEGPSVGGSVKVTVVSFRPQIGAVGDALLAMIGVASDRSADATTVTANLRGFRTAAVFGTLAAIYRAAAGETNATNVALSKKELYETLFAGARRAIEGWVDEDGDGVCERRVRGGVARLTRE